MTCIAIFSTYAPSEGFGGPARIFHLRRMLEASGHDVAHVVVQGTADRSKGRQHDLFDFVERPYGAEIDHVYNDVDLGRRAAGNVRLVERIRRHVEGLGVRAIVMEQPFLVDLVEDVAGPTAIPIVYSCQNVEYRLRRDLERYQYLAKRPRNRPEEVREIEQHAVDLATSVTTICPTDSAKMRDEFGASSVVVPNGTSVANVMAADGITNQPRERVDFAFAGSSYWPNVDGFSRMANPSLAFLTPDTRIHVIGTAGDSLLSTPTMARRYSVNASRLVIRGFLPMSGVIATMRAARAVLVPVFVGEGSNLKSADALAAGVPVIMTERATHGYEDVLTADPAGVTVVPDATEFRSAMAEASRSTRPTDLIGSTRRVALEWSSRLRPVLGVIEDLGVGTEQSR